MSGKIDTMELPVAFVKSPKALSAPTDWRDGKSLTEKNLYMFQNQIQCDVTFDVGADQSESGKQRIKAHSFVLMTSSSVFFSVLGKLPDKKKLAIQLPDVNPKAFRLLLEYAYTDRVTLSPDLLLSILFAARKFKMNSLVKHCLMELQTNITEETVCDYLEQAHKFNQSELRTKCLRYIDKDTAAVFSSDSFCDLCQDCLRTVISRDSLVIRENDVYEAAMRWARNKCEKQGLEKSGKNARDVLGDAFQLIRFPVMNPQYFTKNVTQSDVLTDKEKVDLFKYFFGDPPKPKLQFSDMPRQWNKRASGILFIRPHPDVFAHCEMSGNLF